MQYFFSALALIGSILAVIVSIRTFLGGRALLLPLTTLVFAIRCTFGLAFVPFLPLEQFDVAGQSLSDSAFYYATNPMLYPLQVTAHLTLLMASLGGIKLLKPSISRETVQQEGISIIRFFAFVWFLLAVLLFVRFFLLGPGVQLLLQTRFIHGSQEAAILHRLEAQRMVELGQGYYMAMLGAYIAFPLAAFFSRLSVARFSTFIFTLSAISSLVFAIQTRQKAPPVLVIVTYVALFIATGSRSVDVKYLVTRFALLAVILGVLGTLAYVLNAGLAVGEAIQSFFVRTFMVPPLIESLYFEIFPEEAGFRGILKSFYMPTRLLAPVTNDLSAHDIAYLATGYYYAANASFLAVGWSGAGFLGVLLVVFGLVGTLAIVDWNLSLHPFRVQASVVAMALPSVNVLTSGTIADYVSSGGLFLPVLILCLLAFARGRESLGWNKHLSSAP